jgi:hypothetical protein
MNRKFKRFKYPQITQISFPVKSCRSEKDIDPKHSVFFLSALDRYLKRNLRNLCNLRIFKSGVGGDCVV